MVDGIIVWDGIKILALEQSRDPDPSRNKTWSLDPWKPLQAVASSGKEATEEVGV